MAAPQTPAPALNPPLQAADEITEAVVRLVRKHGLVEAKAMVTSDAAVLFTPRKDDLELFQALQVGGVAGVLGVLEGVRV
jgi:hypothetical protein